MKKKPKGCESHSISNIWEEVSEEIKKCPLVIDGLVTCVDMNVLPLGSYDVLIRMNWLEAHRKMLDCYNNTFEVLG